MDKLNSMETTSDQQGDNQYAYNVHDDPVMRNAIDVLEKLGKHGKVILRAKGNSIPNAVAIANIMTEKLLKGNSKVEKITVDSANPAGIGRMLSTIEIILVKKSQ